MELESKALAARGDSGRGQENRIARICAAGGVLSYYIEESERG